MPLQIFGGAWGDFSCSCSFRSTDLHLKSSLLVFFSYTLNLCPSSAKMVKIDQKAVLSNPVLALPQFSTNTVRSRY